jgi:hypothetical protein
MDVSQVRATPVDEKAACRKSLAHRGLNRAMSEQRRDWKQAKQIHAAYPSLVAKHSKLA